MKNLLLTLCFVFITSLIFCQASTPQNALVHLRYYAHNCVSWNLTNDANKSNGNETAISAYKSLLHIVAGYNRLTDYNIVCSIGQNTWHRTVEVVKPWQYLNGSLRGVGFNSGYSVATGAKGNYCVFDRKLSL